VTAAANPVYEAIRTRRVTRNMSDRPIEPADVELVAHAARYAPNAGNRRLQPVITITDRATIGLLRKVSPGMMPRPQALIVICIDRSRAAAFGFRPDYAGLYVDIGTTAATLLLAAHAVGLAACPVTSFSRAAAARILDTEPLIEPQMMICLGYAADNQPPPMGAPTSR
jgi:nitroreductase